MSTKPSNLANYNPAGDLRGAGRLTIEAIMGIVDIVEAVHHTIANGSGLLDSPEPKRTRGITGLVYRNIRGITKLVGQGLELPLSLLDARPHDKSSSPRREAVMAALNGTSGDHLAAAGNPLAISMQFRRQGIALDDAALRAAVQEANGRLLILIHGACMNDLQWERNGHDHGTALARDLGMVPLYLHYNSGLHISENGRLFSDLLRRLTDLANRPLELNILAYSMGGLVARSACLYAENSDLAWPAYLRKIVFLGTPHHGAPLEKGGSWIHTLMDISPYSAPFSRLGKFRSAGLTDLRYGLLLDDDWQGRDRFEYAKDPRSPVPLPEGVACYALAASTTEEASIIGDDLIGDGLVPVYSALGRHKKRELDLSIPKDRQRIGRGLSHLDLLNNPQVYKTIKNWLTA